jgi:hypothetical protein
MSCKIKINYFRCCFQTVKILFYIVCVVIALVLFFSCKKDKVLTSSSAKLTFSQPNVMFDTVFTSIGSTTQIFRVHNPNNGIVDISSIRLARGSSSFYRLNVDGHTGSAGTVFSGISIAAKDSMYIFVQVTINPSFNPIVSPFIYRDSIIFEVNGNTQYFDLIAFGQNAYYHMPNLKIIESNTLALYYSLDTNVNGAVTHTWKNDKPHLIYGYVVVDSLHNLIIPPGTHIYVHGGGGLWVYRYGSINIGSVVVTNTTQVTFQGDRLEQAYQDVPGQWDRIWINEGSTNNIIANTVIKNAYIGVHAGYAGFGGFGNYTPNVPARLNINHTIIQNCSGSGILAQGYTVTGGDNVIVNCGTNLLEFDYGGSYSFYQCTFANYWNQTNNSNSSSARTTPSFNFNNYYNGVSGNTPSPFDSLYFGNCIMDGSLAEEFNFDTLAGTMPGFTHLYSFNYCALKTGMFNANGAHTNTCQINQNMYFINTAAYNFDIQSNSGAWQKGNNSTLYTSIYTSDINGTIFGSLPNIGAYAN